jgi:hypothetical protein
MTDPKAWSAHKLKVENFVRANHLYLTCQDMVDELGVPYAQVDAACRRLGLKAISVFERNKKFALEMKGKIPLAKIRARLSHSPTRFAEFCSELGLSIEDFELEEWISPRQIFNDYMLSGIHYEEDRETERLKRILEL